MDSSSMSTIFPITPGVAVFPGTIHNDDDDDDDDILSGYEVS